MSSETKDSTVQTFNNDYLTVVVTPQPNCMVKFEMTVQPPALEASYNKAVKNIKKEINIPGFRKGKAPDSLILDRFGPTIQKEWIDVSLDTAFNESIQLTHIFPLKEGRIKRPIVHECDKDKGARFTIEFEVRPKIPELNFDDIQIKKVAPKEITDKDIQQALKQVISQFINYEPVTDRGVEEGDFADLTLDLLEAEGPRRIVNNQRTQINEEDLPIWIKKYVLGLKAGETAEGHSEPSPETEDPNFQSAPFQVTVNHIWTGEVPSFDDALAQKVGAASIDELKQKIQDRLMREAQEEATAQESQQLENLLLEQYSFEIPESIIEHHLTGRLEAYKQEMQANPSQNFNLKEFERHLRASILRQLQLLFLFHKIAAEHQIEVTQEDVTQEFSRQFVLMPSGKSQLDLKGNKEDLRDQIQSLAFDHKIKQFLLDKATFIE